MRYTNGQINYTLSELLKDNLCLNNDAAKIIEQLQAESDVLKALIDGGIRCYTNELGFVVTKHTKTNEQNSTLILDEGIEL